MKKYLILILFAALAVRLTAAVWWEKRTRSLPEPAGTVTEDGQTDGPFFFGDSDSYWKLGRALAFSRPYRFDEQRCWTVFRTPGYPALLAPLFWIGGEHPPVFWARIENALFGVLTVYLTYLLGFYLTGREKIGLFAACVTALEPTLIMQSVWILSDEPYTAVSLLLLILLVRLVKMVKKPLPAVVSASSASTGKKAILTEQTFGLGLAVGLITAAAVLLRPAAVLLLPFIGVFAFTYALCRRNADLSRIGTVCAVLFIALFTFQLATAPWGLRNQRLTGRYIITTLQGGATLYDGLSPNATGAGNMDFVDSFRAEIAADNSNEPTKREFFEVRLDNRLKKEALSWAKSHPADALRLAGIKFVRLWNIWPNEPSFRAPIIRLGIAATYGPVLLLALCGIAVTWKKGFAYRLLWLPALYLTALHLFFVSSLRYRIPIMPLLALLAAIAVFHIYDRFRTNND